MFEAVGVAVVSACILQIIYEKVGGQNTVAEDVYKRQATCRSADMQRKRRMDVYALQQSLEMRMAAD